MKIEEYKDKEIGKKKKKTRNTKEIYDNLRYKYCIE